MKTTLLVLVFSILSFVAFAQTTIFNENFELPSGADSITTVGTPAWSVNTTFYASGARSYRNQPSANMNDTLSMVTIPFNTSGMSSVHLYFNHICKIHWADRGEIYVSVDNGATWVKLTASNYLGTSNFPTSSNSFNSNSYTMIWIPTDTNAIITNSWWQNEHFDISTIAGNQSQVLVKFALSNGLGGAAGPEGNYGWLIDDIRIDVAPSELNPPLISMVTAPSGNIYGSTSVKVDATITDQSGVDTARLVYSITNGTSDTLAMVRLTGDTFRTFIPFFGYGRTYCYKIIAKDASSAHNIAYYPSSNGCSNFMTAYSTGGTFQLGTATTTTSGTCMTPYSSNWEGSRSQYLILASELAALNMPGGNISSLGFKVTTAGGYVLNNFSIKMALTSASSLTTFEAPSSFTTVYSNVSLPIPSLGLNTFNFTTPFVWNGTSNILIDICHDNDVDNTCLGCYGSNSAVEYTTSSFNSVYGAYADNAQSCGVTASSIVAGNATRPNMYFNVQSGSSLIHDIGVSQIVNPNGGVIANQNFNVTAKIKNFGSDSLVSAIVNWKVDGVLKTPFNWTGLLKKDSVSSVFTLGVLNINSGPHSIEIWTENPNGIVDDNWANDAMSFNFYACPNQLSGTYTVGGASPDFAGFNDVMTALTQCGISGPVTFNIAPGTYTNQLTIPAIYGSSATNIVTFKSANNDSTSVILQYEASSVSDNWVVKLNGASNFVFNGLTIKALDSVYSTAVELAGNASNLIFTRNVIMGSQYLLTGMNEVVFKSLSTSKDSLLTFTNNKVMNGYDGLYLKGVSATDLDKSINITSNVFMNQYRYSAYFESIDALKFNNNVVLADSTLSNAQGVYLLNIKNQWNFKNNNIAILQGARAMSIWNCNSEIGSEAIIANNMIFVAGVATHVIDFANGTNMKFLYNTINRYSSTAGDAVWINETSGITDSLYFQNNIFSNTGSLGTIININFATGLHSLVFDYNNYFNAAIGFGSFSGAVSNFAAWKTKTAQDVHSMSVNPYFVSYKNLHVLNNLLNGAALPFASITLDIDGDARNATTPDIGADEFQPSPHDLVAIEFITPAGECSFTNSEVVKLKMKNAGSAAINGGFTASYLIKGAAAPVTENVSATINSGDTLTYTFTTHVNLDVFALGHDSTFQFTAWTSLGTDPLKVNDTTFASKKSGFTPLAPIVSDTTIYYGQSVVLTGVSTDTLNWYGIQNSVTPLYIGKFFNTGSLYDTTKYFVEAKQFSSVQATIGTGTSVSSSSSFPTAFENYWYQTWQQYLFTKAELNAMGISGGAISSIAMNITSLPDQNYFASDYNVQIGTTSSNALTGFVTSNLTNVYGPTTYTGAAIGWNTISFSTPFIWDGNSNIIIDIRQTGAYGNANAITSFTATPNTSAVFGYSSTNNSGYWASGVVGSTSSNRPNIKFSATKVGCPSPRSPLTVKIIGFPMNDAGLIKVVEPIGSIPAGITHAVKVQLKNFGIIPLTSTTIKYSVNNVPQPSFVWNGNLAYKDSIIVKIDSITPHFGINSIKAYTTLPNNVADTINSNDTTNSTFIACLNGVYTIGDTTGGIQRDFVKIGDAVNALSTVGVCGHVIFKLDTGTYNQQIKIPAITGSGPNSTITFESANGDSSKVKIVYDNTNGSNWVVNLNGAKYVTLKGLTIQSNAVAANGRALVIDNLTENVTITNCVIKSILGSVYTSASIYCSSNNINLTIKNNRIEKGYYGIYFSGSSTSSLAKKLVISNNIVKGFDYSGMYLMYTDSMIVSKNLVDGTENLNYGYGIYAYYCYNDFQIVNNTLLFDSLNLYSGIYLNYNTGTAAKRALIANNMVSLFGPLASTSTTNMINCYYSNYQDIMFNSVYLNKGSSTSSAINVTYGGNNRVTNNTMINEGTGVAYYVPAATGVGTSNYNNFYSAGANLAFWTANRATLADLQTASTKDAASINVSAAYVSPTDLHQATTALVLRGNANARVLYDFDGQLRAAKPTIGADEREAVAIDAGVTKLILTPITGVHEFDIIHVQAVISNFGLDTLFTFPINYKVNNGTPVVFNYNDTLATFGIDTVNLADYISPAGNVNVCAYTQVTGDTNFFNDQSCKSYFSIPAWDVKSIKISKLAEGCNLTTDSVRLRITNIGSNTIKGNLTAKYQVNGGTIQSQIVTDSILVGDSLTVVFTQPINLVVTMHDSLFAVKAWAELLNDNVEYNDTAYTKTNSAHTPMLPIASNISIPYASYATVNATSPNDDSLTWWDAPIAGNKLIEGPTYTSPLLYVNDTFYVEAHGGLPPTDIQLGNATTSTSVIGLTPYSSYYEGARSQYLIRASEIAALGVSSGQISSVTFTVTSASAYNMNDFVIKLGETSATAMSGSYITPANGFTTVYSNPSEPMVAAGTKTYVFSTPFNWDGSSNLVFDICHDNDISGTCAACYGTSGTVAYTATTFNSVFGSYADNVQSCGVAPVNPLSSTYYTNRPNMKLNIIPIGCSSPRAMVVVQVGAIPPFDAGVIELFKPTSMMNLNSAETVKVRIKNFGNSPISNFQVSYKIDNLPTVTETVAATIPFGDTITYTFVTKANLSVVGQTYGMKAWTTLASDASALNDTINKSVTNLNTSYCACAAQYTSGEEDITEVTIGSQTYTSQGTGVNYTDNTNQAPFIMSPSATFNILVGSTTVGSGSYSCWMNVFIDYNRDGDFDDVDERVFSSAMMSTDTVSANITVPSWVDLGTTRMRVVLRESGSQANTGPCGLFSYGECEDYNVTFAPIIPKDLSVETIYEPGDLVQANLPLQISARVKNMGSDTLAIGSFQVGYTLGVGSLVAQSNTVAMAPGDTALFVFTNVLFPNGYASLCVKTILAGDTNTFNNERCKNVFGLYYAQIPYVDNFEVNNNWYHNDTIWQLGAPNGTTINAAHSGTKALMTLLNQNYPNNTSVSVLSPLFDFSILGPADTATMKFWYRVNTELTNDGAKIEYTVDGTTWINLSYFNDTLATNGYNTNANLFSGVGVWKEFSKQLDPTTFNIGTPVQFRMKFVSNATTNTFDGFAFDDFSINLPVKPFDAMLDSILTPVNSVVYGAPQTVSVRFKNTGINPLTSVPLYYHVDGANVVNDTWVGNLAPGQSQIFTFLTTFTPTTAANSLVLCARVNVAADGWLPNDSAFYTLAVKAPAKDAGVIEIITPLPDTTYLGMLHTVKVRIKNFGTTTLTAMDVQYKPGLSPQVVEPWTGTLLPDSTVEFTFATKYSPQPAWYQLCSKTILPNDGRPTNDQLCRNRFGGINPGFGDVWNSMFTLDQNVPNPANDLTSIYYEVPTSGNVKFQITDLLGQVLRSQDFEVSAGRHQIDLDAKLLSSGVYYYSIEMEGHRLVKKMIVTQ